MTRTDTAQFEGCQLDRLSGVILLDEPSGSLDLRHCLSMMETLRADAATRDVAVVVALHDVSLAGRYYDRLTLLSDGVIAADGPPAVVLTPANLRRAFGVETTVQPDPATGRPQVWLIGPAE